MITPRRSGDGGVFTHHEGFNPRWWSVYRDDARLTYVQVLHDGAEVARVLLDEIVGIEYYADAPALGATALQIELLEVSEEFRLEGIGTEVVRHLAELHPERRLVAFSEGADDFWASLGWRCHKHRTDPDLCQLLYIHPERCSDLPG